MDKQNALKVKRIASLYRDLLSNKFHAISENEKDILLSIKPNIRKEISWNVQKDWWIWPNI